MYVNAWHYVETEHKTEPKIKEQIDYSKENCFGFMAFANYSVWNV